jgi:restriction system protein
MDRQSPHPEVGSIFRPVLDIGLAVTAPRHPGITTPPTYGAEFLRYLNPILDVLREKGGQARPREVYDAIAAVFELTEEERTRRNKTGPVRFENQVAWARSYLAETGYLDSRTRGVWQLTEKGRAARLDGPDIDAIIRGVQEVKHLRRTGAPPSPDTPPIDPATNVGEDEDIAPSPQTSPYSDHRPALIALIGTMTPEGFEHFCSELLARVGVEDVQTTSYSRDGGIDGIGRLRINEFVTMPIAFQAKKLDGSGRRVSAEEIQRFRGAMDASVEKGIFFTTTGFTDDARRQARRAGYKEIELVDLERILSICEAYRIGLSEQTILVPDPIFFERFRR